jgi:lipopolysaccharide export system permease protein
MLFKKALRTDLTNLAGVIFATLFTIMVTTTLIRLLGRAANGGVDTGSVLPLVAFASVGFLPILLILTLYMSVLMGLTRQYRDSEMVIWFSAGQSPLAWVRPVLAFAMPFAALVAVVAFFVAPWALRQNEEYQKRFEQRDDVAHVAAGQFRESASAERVFFVESVDEASGQVRNVFVTQSRGEDVTVVVSSRGHLQEEPDGSRFLVLEDGRRYDGKSGQAEFKLMEFGRYGLRIEPRTVRLSEGSAKVKGMGELLADPTAGARAELLWRLSLPVCALVLAMLAIPLSAANPRMGRSINLAVALLLYVVYTNLVSLMQGWVAQQKLDFLVGLVGIHLAFAVLVAVMFWRRSVLFMWEPLLGRLRGGRS